MQGIFSSRRVSYAGIPGTEYGGDGHRMHFAHANGYPPGAYLPLLRLLAADFSLSAMDLRPLWVASRPEDLKDWSILAADLIRYLHSAGDAPWIGVGHSLGGNATLRAALRQPDLFSALVLIDPVVFPPWMNVFWRLIFSAGLAYRVHPLVRSALRRRREFASLDAMVANYRKKPVFARVDDAGVEAYAASLVAPSTNGGVTLSYTPEWEARIYATSNLVDNEIWRSLSGLKPPLLILRGTDTDTFWEITGRLLRKKLPQARIVTIPGTGHLLPLEKPLDNYQEIKNFLRNV